MNNMAANMRVAGVELGGTKAIALIAQGTNILDQISIPTESPAITLTRLREKLEAWYAEESFASIGIASFGPLQLNPDNPDFGCVLKTPKPGWSSASVAENLTRGFSLPWSIDTDVNGAALAEYRWGAGKDCDSLCYITIGTGVGGGLVLNGKAVHGMMHPEIGHIRIRRSPGDTFSGVCPFHGDCIEGLVSGPALAARFGNTTNEVPDSHPTWEKVADDISELACTILLTVSAQRILIGGGVGSKRPFLLPMVQERVLERLGGYLPIADIASVSGIIRAPGLGLQAGPLGAIALAYSAFGD